MQERLEVDGHFFDIKIDGIVDYHKAIEYLKNRVERYKKGISPEMLWGVEHNLVYTGGKISTKDDVIDRSINSVQTNRGGKWTCHSNGQIIVYFVYDLNGYFAKKNNINSIRDFVDRLERSVVEILNSYDIETACQLHDNRGVWAMDNGTFKKIASIGLSVSRGIVYHGMSINFDNDLNLFNKIVPCGTKDECFTSIKLLGTMEKKNLFKQKIIKILRKNLFTS